MMLVWEGEKAGQIVPVIQGHNQEVYALDKRAFSHMDKYKQKTSPERNT